MSKELFGDIFVRQWRGICVNLYGAVVGDFQAACGVRQTLDVAPSNFGLVQHYSRPRASTRNERLDGRVHTASDGDENGYFELAELAGGHADDDFDRAVLLHEADGGNRLVGRDVGGKGHLRKN